MIWHKFEDVPPEPTMKDMPLLLVTTQGKYIVGYFAYNSDIYTWYDYWKNEKISVDYWCVIQEP